MAHDEEIPRFRPRMGRRLRPKRERLSLRRYLLSNVHYASRRGGAGARANIAVRPPRRDSRRVLVKAHFVGMTAQGGGAQAAHLRYIQRDGIDAEASPSVLYGPEGPIQPETAHEVRPGEKRQFRTSEHHEIIDVLGHKDAILGVCTLQDLVVLRFE